MIAKTVPLNRASGFSRAITECAIVRTEGDHRIITSDITFSQLQCFTGRRKVGEVGTCRSYSYVLYTSHMTSQFSLKRTRRYKRDAHDNRFNSATTITSTQQLHGARREIGIVR